MVVYFIAMHDQKNGITFLVSQNLQKINNRRTYSLK